MEALGAQWAVGEVPLEQRPNAQECSKSCAWLQGSTRLTFNSSQSLQTGYRGITPGALEER